jgi:sec-independent protein translocase protein TatC
MVLAFGVLFDLPIFMVGLVRMGVLSTAGIKKSRKLVIVGIFVLAAILTPSPDPISQLLLAVPLWALFEISLVVARFSEKKKP